MEPFKFTKSRLNELPSAPKGRQVEYFDSHVRGLRLRVGSSGLKTFYAVRKYKGKFIRTALGRFPEISVDQARTMALETLGVIGVTGRNPNETRRENQLANVSLRDALELYIETRGNRLKTKTANQYRSVLGNFSGDWLDRPIGKISRDDTQIRHKAITEGTVWFGDDLSKLRKGVGTGSKAQANLWGRTLRAIYNFSYDHYRDTGGNKLLPESPMVALSAKRQWHESTRKSTRIRNRELGRWLMAVDDVRSEALNDRDDAVSSVCDALDMALFTGLRRGEVFGLTWDRVNISGGYFWIDETKNGEKLELPLTETLLAILKRREEYRNKNDVYVFPACKGGIITDPRRAIRKIVEKTSSGINSGKDPINFTCHDARRTFSTIAEHSGVGTYILKRLINHKSGNSSDVTQGYISLPVEELIEPAEKIERKILHEAGIKKSTSRIDVFLNSLTDEDKISLLNKILKADK
ncbi:tyrosine-type recombinase/integrase [Enterobacter sp. PTB]|uniref:tyrosine-type recombinase/integrase n=1 Tax=Enterobacter sp. PTB TaxID=3143437 RepID=UPI003DA87C40